jgi:hypothetical protein
MLAKSSGRLLCFFAVVAVPESNSTRYFGGDGIAEEW